MSRKQPVVDRDTKYYLENIGKVKSIEEFVNNDRLFRYAMKAHGLEDMTYAKAFMIKALKEGIANSDSFANKLTDKRYAEFVTSYNFAKYGELATSYNRAQHDVPKNFATQVELASFQEGFDHYGDRDGLLPDEHLERNVSRRVDGRRPPADLRDGGIRT